MSSRPGTALTRTVSICLLVALLGACSTVTPEQRASAAKALFDQTVKQYHLPSAEVTGAQRDQLLTQAAAGYEQLLRQYRDQPYWCAQALRSLGNIRAAQNRLDDAVQLYRQVGNRYPRQDWEVLQAWKSAGDLLWDANRKDEAREFYRQIVKRFDAAEAPAVYRVIVRSSQKRLAL